MQSPLPLGGGLSGVRAPSLVKIDSTLPGWLTRRFAQTGLRVV
jgi:hypothetical protein